jgi:hypothetical protein
MNQTVSANDMDIRITEIRPLPGGACYEAKVLDIFISAGSGRKPAPRPPGMPFWSLGFGHTRQEAQESAVMAALKELKRVMAGPKI